MLNHTEVRVRFAPSPTGYLHIGNFRTALFNFLFARANGGQFLLRIEDTDLVRSKKIFADALLDTLAWVGIEHDESIIYQSDSIAQHHKAIEQLLTSGAAYRCYCASNPIASKTDYIRYDGNCRIQLTQAYSSDQPYVVRIKLPIEQKTIYFRDLIRGVVTFSLDEFDDFIIARSDGTPVYNLAVVVDDADMGITQVIRGEDHISNTPKQIILYQALGYTVPQFAHLPLILGVDGKRLSKRNAVTAIDIYRKDGYLPDALVNYLLRLGWAHGDQEIFSRDQMIEFFSLEHVGKSSAIFDQSKLNWLNGVYLRELPGETIFYLLSHEIDPDFVAACERWSELQIIGFIDLYKQRFDTIKEIAVELRRLYHATDTLVVQDIVELKGSGIDQVLIELIDTLYQQDVFDEESIATLMKKFCKQRGIKISDIGQPMRLALTGTYKSPGIFSLIALFGKETVIERLRRFSELITK